MKGTPLLFRAEGPKFLKITMMFLTILLQIMCNFPSFYIFKRSKIGENYADMHFRVFLGTLRHKMQLLWLEEGHRRFWSMNGTRVQIKEHPWGWKKWCNERNTCSFIWGGFYMKTK